MKIDGKCLCGDITYKAEADPGQSYICNCTDCQTLAGSAFRWSVTIPEVDFKLLTGKPKTFNKPSESGQLLPMVFCPNCGSSIYSVYTIDGAKFLNVRVPTATQSAEFPPKSQYWQRSAQEWVTNVDLLEGHETE